MIFATAHRSASFVAAVLVAGLALCAALPIIPVA